MRVHRIFLPLFLSLSLLFGTEFSQAQKEKKIYPMGEKIYTKKCRVIDASTYKDYQALQNAIKKEALCDSLSSSHLKVVSIYLWDKTHLHHKQKTYPKLTATKKEKCPVCGMFLYKYPEWISRINYSEKSYGFDGIKDLMKFYFENQTNIEEILVQDYYTQETLEAREAYFVTGSDVYGPMGNELLAFRDKKSAQRFMIDHRGKELLRFEEITVQKVYKLDE